MAFKGNGAMRQEDKPKHGSDCWIIRSLLLGAAAVGGRSKTWKMYDPTAASAETILKREQQP